MNTICGTAALWNVLMPPRVSFADEPRISSAHNPTRNVISPVDPAQLALWKQRWKESIISNARGRYCDKELGEEIGWLISPLLDGFYYGYLATADAQWIDRLVDWTDSWIRRGVTEPDGFVGWPKVGAAGTPVDDLDSYDADSLLGEAMALKPVVLASALILKDAALKAKY